MKLLVKKHRPRFLFLSEVKCHDCGKIQHLVSKLNFTSFDFVPAIGKAGGLLLAWNSSVNIQVIVTSTNFINALFFFCEDLIATW